jgi:orsellinic acid C2-O-methyltransferase
VALSPLVQTIMGYLPTQAMYVACELEVPDLIGDGARRVDDLAQATSSDPVALRRVLRALVAFGILRQPDPSDPDLMALTDDGQLLRADSPRSLRSFARMSGQPEWWTSCGDLVSSVRTGKPAFDQAFGMPLFAWFAEHPDKARTFGEAMTGLAHDTVPGIVAGYDWGRFGTIVDVGGSEGTLVSAILAANPAMRGVLFDLEAGLAGAADVLAGAGVADRCDVVAGDFFDSVPAGGDAYVLRQVVHDWDDDECVRILRTCREAMGPDGRLLVLERVVPDMVTPDLRDVLMVDVVMLALLTGSERGERQYHDLFAAAGFTLTGMSPPLGTFYDRVIEGVPT